MSETTTGGCVCGAVRYEVEPEFKLFQYCHCSRCRKFSGTSNGCNIFIGADKLRWLAGEDTVRTFKLPEAKYWGTSFCPTCGSAVPRRTPNGKSYVLPAGGLDSDPGPRPTRNVYFASRATWLTPCQELASFDTFPGDTTGS